eukprot:3496340-Prymnesium_polylepis.1
MESARPATPEMSEPLVSTPLKKCASAQRPKQQAPTPAWHKNSSHSKIGRTDHSVADSATRGHPSKLVAIAPHCGGAKLNQPVRMRFSCHIWSADSHGTL